MISGLFVPRNDGRGGDCGQKDVTHGLQVRASRGCSLPLLSEIWFPIYNKCMNLRVRHCEARTIRKSLICQRLCSVSKRLRTHRTDVARRVNSDFYARS